MSRLRRRILNAGSLSPQRPLGPPSTPPRAPGRPSPRSLMSILAAFLRRGVVPAVAARSGDQRQAISGPRLVSPVLWTGNHNREFTCR